MVNMQDNISIKSKARIMEKTELADGIYSMTLCADLCSKAEPGQFVMVYPNNGAKLLGRPICIASVKKDTAGSGEDLLRIVFRTVGDGTREIASYGEGDRLFIEGPLGHGYPTDEAISGRKHIVLLGGGLGAPSLLYLAESLTVLMNTESTVAENAVPKIQEKPHITAILGYRDSSLKHFLADDFRLLGINTVIATDDGSEGLKGNVIDALKETVKEPDLIYACGPLPMLSAVKKYAGAAGIKAYISMEERMACGVGVCLGCVAKTVKEDPHSHVKNARVCTEGPVFDADEVDI